MAGPRIAALVKQVPRFENMTLGADGRLRREGVELEMNPYCRRAVATAVELSAASGGEAVVLTMGPPSAEDCLREAIAWGVERGVLLTDRALAGSDTLATAAALCRLLAHLGGFDLVLVGKNSVDADTGQVGPELAELLGATFAGPCRELQVDFAAASFRARCETDDGHRDIEGELPAVLACAERLCAPAKMPPEDRAAVDASRIQVVSTADLGRGPWGAEASPTTVGVTRSLAVDRAPVVLHGPVADQVAEAVALLQARGAFDPSEIDGFVEDHHEHSPQTSPAASEREVWALVEPSRPGLAHELGQEAARIGRTLGMAARVVSMGPGVDAVPSGVSGMTILDGDPAAGDEDYARTLSEIVTRKRPWGVLAASTTRGREVASRVAAAGGQGLTGDAVELDVDGDGNLVAWKPAFGGAIVAAITSSSPVQMVTVRPGVLPRDVPVAPTLPPVTVLPVTGAGRVRVVAEEVEDDCEALTKAHTVVCAGIGVDPDDYGELERFAKLLDAEIGATRKVTDRGWMPRSRQIGITGQSVAPRLFVSVAASGKFNHASGFRAARTVLAVNSDRNAAVFGYCDVGVVGDWREVLALVAAELTLTG